MHRISSIRERGMVALITVIAIAATLLTVGITAALVGQTDLIIAGHADLGRSARMLATACVEESLQRLKLDSAYAGGTIALDADSCTVTVSGTGSTRTVTVSATLQSYTRTIVVGAVLKQNAAASAKAWAVDAWSESDPP